MLFKYVMDVYPRTLYVAINESTDKIMEFLHGNDGDCIPDMKESSNAYEVRVTDGVNGGSLIRFKSIADITPGIIAHEAFHSAMAFCDYLGINFDMSENNEHVAYLIEWIVNKLNESKRQYDEYIKNLEIDLPF